MSDSHVAPLLPENRRRKEAPFDWINAGAVLETVLQQLPAEKRKTIALRCDELPYLQGSGEVYQKIFSLLLRMILDKKEAVSRLFLHIRSKTEEDESPPSSGVRWFSIQFHTNIEPCYNWMQAHEQQIAEIQALLKNNNGSLAVAQTTAQGCIFFLFLPGKLF